MASSKTEVKAKGQIHCHVRWQTRRMLEEIAEVSHLSEAQAVEMAIEKLHASLFRDEGVQIRRPVLA